MSDPQFPLLQSPEHHGSESKQHQIYRRGIELIVNDVLNGNKTVDEVLEKIVGESGDRDSKTQSAAAAFIGDVTRLDLSEDVKKVIQRKGEKTLNKWIKLDNEGVRGVFRLHINDADAATVLERFLLLKGEIDLAAVQKALANNWALHALVDRLEEELEKIDSLWDPVMVAEMRRELTDAKQKSVESPKTLDVDVPPAVATSELVSEPSAADLKSKPVVIHPKPSAQIARSVEASAPQTLDASTIKRVRNSETYRQCLRLFLDKCFFQAEDRAVTLNSIADSNPQQLDEVVNVLEHDLKEIDFGQLRTNAHEHAKQKTATWENASKAKLLAVANSEANKAEPADIILDYLTAKKKKSPKQLANDLGMSIALGVLVDRVRSLGDKQLIKDVEILLPRYAQRGPESVLSADESVGEAHKIETPINNPFEFEQDFTDVEIKAMPEYPEYLKRVFDVIIAQQREDDAEAIKKCADDLREHGTAVLRARGKRAQERNAAAKYVAKLLLNNRAELGNEYIRVYAIIEKDQLITQSNFGLFKKELSAYIAAYTKINNDPDGEHTYEDFIKHDALVMLRNELLNDPNSKRTKFLIAQLEQQNNTEQQVLSAEATSALEPLSDAAVEALAVRLSGSGPQQPPQAAIQVVDADGNPIALDDLHKIDGGNRRPDRKPPRKGSAAADTSRSPDYMEREMPKPRVLSPSEIPSAGSEGTMMVAVYIDERGTIHSGEDTVRIPLIRKNGDKTVVEYRGNRLNYHFQDRRTLISEPGIYTVQVRVLSRKKGLDAAPIELQVELATDTYEFGKTIRPIAYNSKKRTFLLPNNEEFTLAHSELDLVDSAGFLVSNNSQRPLLEIRGRLPEKSIAKYYGVIVTAEEVELRGQLDHALRDYREFAFAKYRTSTKENPLDLVVSSRATSLKRGMEDFRFALKQLVTPENKAIVAELDGMSAVAHERLIQFEKKKTSGDGFWDDYVRFFDRVQQEDVKELFGGNNIRRFYFPSDLDGEMSISMFERAGIPIRVVLFPPDGNRTDGIYRARAVHLDISHGSGEKYEFPSSVDVASPDEHAGETVIFLDEDKEKSFSAAQTTYEHLLKLGLISTARRDDRAVRQMLQFVADHDSYTGLYESQEDCKRILASMDRNIFGFVSQLTDLGRFNVVVEFFQTIVPEIESKLLKERSELAGHKNIGALRTAVMRQLVEYDIRDFVAEHDKELFGGYRNLAHEQYDLLIETRKRFKELEANGFVGETRFGKTLFDPGDALSYFDPIEKRKKSLASIYAFAMGYDCYVGYRDWQKSCVINVAPFARRAEKQIELPTNLFRDEATGDAIGQVIKGGRYFVMNASSQKLKDFEQIVRAFLNEDGVVYKPPRGVAEYIAAEKQWPDAARDFIRKIHPGMLEDQDRARGRVRKATVVKAEVPPKEQVPPLPENIYELAERLQGGLDLIAADPIVRIRDGRQIRQDIVAAYTKLNTMRDGVGAEFKIRVGEMLENAHRMMVIEAFATWRELAKTLVAPGMRERVRAYKREDFENQYFAITLVRLGFNAYRSVFTEDERRKLRAQWSQNLVEVWDSATAK